MADYDELLNSYINKFEREIFHILVDNQLLVKNHEFFHQSLPKIVDRLEMQKESAESKISLLRNHIDGGGNLERFDRTMLNDLTFVLTQTMFGYFQIFKSYLFGCVDPSKVNLADDRQKFSEMVKKLAEFRNSEGGLLFHYDGLRKFFNIDVFHALENDLWWLNENLEFTFEEIDGTIISYNVGELQGELAGINAIVLAFTKNYVKIFDGSNYDNMMQTYPHLFR